MTIKARLWLMASIAVIGLLSIFATGKTGIDSLQVNFDKVVDDRMPKIDAADHLVANAIRQDRDIREIVLTHTPEQMTALDNNIAKAREENKKHMDYLHANIHSEKGKALLHHADETHGSLRKFNDKIFSLAHAGNKEEATNVILSEAYHKAGGDYRHALEEISAMQKEVAHHAAIESRESGANANMWMLIISVLAIGILIGIALMVIRNVSGAITQIASSVTQVASTMKFNTRLPARNDELNAVSQSLNGMLASLETAVADSNKVIGAIAQGDFSQRIHNSYVGDLDNLKQGINSSAENISCVMNNLQEAMQALKAGQLSAKVNADAPGSYGVMLDYVKTSFKELNAVIEDINHVVDQIKNGHFDARVNANAHGDLLIMKDNFNRSMETLAQVMNSLHEAMQALKAGQFSSTNLHANAPGSYGVMLDSVKTSFKELGAVIEDINHVVEQMKNGHFDARVNANANGDLFIMKDNFNRSMEITAQVLRSIVEVVEAQAQGDLTKQLPSGSYLGLFHDLKNAMNYSAESVKEKVIVAINASMVVNEAANQVSQGASDLSSRVQEQAAALEQTSATMNQMTSAVQANTENAAKVAALAHQAQDQSKSGVAVMQQTIEAMKSIQDASSKIAEIVNIIDSIAFQTNLLALNAAVEAARAGEHGRGFAVVASEVRALAGKSADAAKGIKSLINDSVDRIDAGTKLADKSGEMLAGMSQSVAQVATMIESISSASREQSTGINQVHRAVADIDKVTQENAALVEETSAAAASLTTEANGLRDSMAFFKTGQQATQGSRTALTSRPSARPHSAPAKKPAALPAPKKGNGEEWGDF